MYMDRYPQPLPCYFRQTDGQTERPRTVYTTIGRKRLFSISSLLTFAFGLKTKMTIGRSRYGQFKNV